MKTTVKIALVLGLLAACGGLGGLGGPAIVPAPDDPGPLCLPAWQPDLGSCLCQTPAGSCRCAPPDGGGCPGAPDGGAR